MDTTLNTNNVAVPVDDNSQTSVNNSNVIFDEKGRLKVTEQLPTVESKQEQYETTLKTEITPSIENSVEKELPKEAQPTQEQPIPVSYTHLTLPTIYSV